MRAYRALLCLYPASFRAEYGGEMAAIATAVALALVMTTLGGLLPALRATRRSDHRYSSRIALSFS